MKRKICMLAYTFYSSDPRVRREAEALASLSGYEVTFYALKENDLPVTYELDGVQVIELNLSKYQGKNKFKYIASYINFMLKMFIVCSKLFFLRKVDVIHVNNMPDFLVFAAIIPRVFGKRVILDIHDSMPETFSTKFTSSNKLIHRLFCWEEAVCCKFADKVICVNHVQRDKLIARGIPSEKIDICMNVPDHKRFFSEGSKKSIERLGDKFKIVYHGTLAKRLGIDLVIRAVARLIDEIPRIEFHVIGSGDDKQEFIKLSKNLNVEKSVIFSSREFPVQDIPGILDGMNLGVIANRKNVATELMLPVKMLEYVALNIPVVAPKLKTIQYYFSDDMVTFFEPENIESLTEAILELFLNRSKMNTQAFAARKFLDSYGWENHRFDFINLYRRI